MLPSGNLFHSKMSQMAICHRVSFLLWLSIRGSRVYIHSLLGCFCFLKNDFSTSWSPHLLILYSEMNKEDYIPTAPMLTLQIVTIFLKKNDNTI